ncbi:ferritin [bacterium]|nr:ferritin [bacterium]
MQKDIRDALNLQVNREYFAMYLYLAMASHFEAENLTGFAKWFALQSAEERGHAEKILRYLLERGERVELEEIAKPPMSWDSPRDAVAAALEHEKKVTGWINEIVDLAIKHNDHATNIFLHWFVEEQVEEESSVEAILDRLEMMGDFKGGLFLMDRELATREA